MKKPKGFKEGWKVVNKDKQSVFAHKLCDYAVDYDINKVTKPKAGCGPLGVFIDRRTADLFADHNGLEYNKIYKCFYKPSKQQNFLYPKLTILRVIYYIFGICGLANERYIHLPQIFCAISQLKLY